MIDKILDSKKFDEIETNGNFGLKDILEKVQTYSEVDFKIIKKILNSPKFDEIEISGQTLGNILLWVGVVRNNKDIADKIINCNKFDAIEANGTVSLETILFFALEHINKAVIQKIINSSKFDEINIDQLKNILDQAFEYNNLEVINKIRNCKKFYKMGIDNKQLVGRLLDLSILEHHSIIVNSIIHDEKTFDAIEANGEWGLGNLLHNAILYNNDEVIDKILNSPKFDEIVANVDDKILGLGLILEVAMNRKKLAVIDKIINCKQFDKINLNGFCGLSELLWSSINYGCFDVTKKIISKMKDLYWFENILKKGACRYFKSYLTDLTNIVNELIINLDSIIDNGQNELGKILCTAACFNDQEIGLTVVKTIMNSKKFDEIPIYGDFGIANIFWIAAIDNHLEAVEELMKSQRFNEIETDVIADTLKKVIEEGYVKMAKMIMNCSKFNEIGVEGEYGLLSMLEIAIKKDLTEIDQILEKRISELCSE